MTASRGKGIAKGEFTLTNKAICERPPATGPIPQGLASTSDKFTSYKYMGDGIGYIRVEQVGLDTDRGVEESRSAMKEAAALLIDITDADEGDRATLAAQTPYRGRFAVLMSARTKGHAERYARDMVENIAAPLYGETTAGCLSFYTDYPLPRNLGRIILSTKPERGVGKPAEFNGISPAKEILWDSEDLENGRSTFIESAIQFMKATHKR
ncbi:MAG: hypothetical protein Kow00107_10700 [Planctomycetota bacterium]